MPETRIQSPVWDQAILAAAEPERVRQRLTQLATLDPVVDLAQADPETARILAAVFSASQWAGEMLIARPDWLPRLAPDPLRHPRLAQGLAHEVDEILQPCLDLPDYPRGFAALREFKQQEMLRIAARDLAGLGQTQEIIREISDVADVCLHGIYRLCWQQLTERFGHPYHQDSEGAWQPTQFCVLGLGKLGGQELNYSSDVDVIFIYADEGGVFKETPTTRTARFGLSNHQFFTRLAEAYIREVSWVGPQGFLYRIDLRLRPEGDAGPLVRSLDSYELYYAQWGQTWERLMLLKGRGVAGDRSLAGEFLEMVHTFRYPRSISARFLDEVRAMKDRTEREVVRAGNLDRDVKRGRGGIREIEFVAQTLQLLHAGRYPFLQGAQTIPVLTKLVQYHLLAQDQADELTAAYCFFRNVEHRLQMEDNQQTHTIPIASAPRERLARLMGFPDWTGFEVARWTHAQRVRAIYDHLLKADRREPQSRSPGNFEAAEPEWRQTLAARSFRDPDKAVKLLREFAHGPGFGHTSSRTTELALDLIAKILAQCPAQDSAPAGPAPSPTPETSLPRLSDDAGEPEAAKPSAPAGIVLSDPDRVVARLDSFVAAYGARATLYEMWTHNPALFELLLLLFDRSEFLAEKAIHTPDMVDDLVLTGHLRRRKNAPEILRELQRGREDADQASWIRRYHNTEFMRLGLRDILGLADWEQNLKELSALADACVQYALEVVLRQHNFRTAPFVVVGLGKLGGEEIDYGSDLDLLFVAPTQTRNLPRLQPLAAKLMEMLAAQTELGLVYHVDARLRPDGAKGLLVNTLDAYEDYYRQRAQLWEIQALTRVRPVAGDFTLGKEFEALAGTLSDFRPETVARGFRMAGAPQRRGRKAADRPQDRPPSLAAYTPSWKSEIHKMRLRIETERTPAGQEALAIKTGAGGMVDGEFLAQSLCLAHGWQEPNTLRVLERARETGALSLEDADTLLFNYRQLRRVEAILRRWSYEGEILLPNDPAAQYRVAVRCGWRNAGELLEATARCRQAMRAIYDRFFNA